ncbi:MAG: ABC transporter permease subunit [Gemmatimonadetes bacterium]|nr:ABC transporter permease subunit [Gemmatimonadota bacterium]
MNRVPTPPTTPTAATPRPRRAPSGARTAWTIALRELTDHVTSARFLVIALLVVGLTPLAVYVGASDYAVRLGEANRLEAERQELAAGRAGERVTGRDDPWTAENELQVLRAVRAPEPLSVLVRGMDGALPAYWDFSPTGTEAGSPASLPQRMADLFGQLDLEFLVRVVLGLLAILLAFDAVAGEKETGTLRAALSQPISRPAFLTGKLLGGAITLLVPLVFALLAALLSARLFGADLLTGDTVGKVALLGTTSALYLLCFYALGLLVSSLATSQKTSLVVLLMVWVVAVLAIPPLSTLMAQAISPVPPAAAIQTRKQALEEDLRREAEVAMGDAYRDATGHPEGMVSGQAAGEHGEEIGERAAPAILSYVNERRRLVGEVERDTERRAARQGKVAYAIMAVSPAAAFARAAADLAGTGDAHHAAWLIAARAHQGRLDEALFEDPPTLRALNGGASITIERRDPPSLADLPAFAAPRRDAAAAVQRALPGLGLLVLFTAVFTSGAFVAFARYDVR